MQKITINLELLAPIIVSNLTGDENTVRTNQFIPGSTLLGALAKEFIKDRNLGKNAHKDFDFRNWFLEEKIFFPNLYPTAVNSQEESHSFFPHQFYLQQEKDDKDNLYNLFSNEEKRIYETPNGFSSIREGQFSRYSPKTWNHFHHERDYGTGTSSKGKIFTYESLSKGATFTGAIILDDDLVKRFSNWLQKERILYIGRSKNSQYGKVKLRVHDINPMGMYEDVNLVVNLETFILSFLSDCILLNENEFPSTDIRLLEKYLPGCQIQKSIQKSHRVEGFNWIWKLRKKTDIAFKSGSSYLIKIVDSSKKENLKNNLLTYFAFGIGERTEEGFGRIALSKNEKTILNLKDEEYCPIRFESKQLSKTTAKSWEKLVQNIYLKEIQKLVYAEVLKDIEELKIRYEKSTIANHIMEFVNKETGRFEYHKEEDSLKTGKLLRKPLERNIEKLKLKNDFLFDYFKKKRMDGDNLLTEDSNLKALEKDYPFLKKEIKESYLLSFYFSTFAILLRKKIKNKKESA